MEKIIFHIDVNSAFLSWEAVYRLKHLGGNVDLRRIPSAVGGDMAMRRGIILPNPFLRSNTESRPEKASAKQRESARSL